MVMQAYNVGRRAIPDEKIESSIARAAMSTGSRPRVDAHGNAGYHEGMIDTYRSRWDAEAIGALRADPRWQPDPEVERWRCDAMEARGDAAPVVGAPGFARDFEFIHEGLIEEIRPPLSAMTLFPKDSSLPLGWPTHTFRRVTVSGRARWHLGGDTFPTVAAGYAEETFRTGFVVCAVEQSFFIGLQMGVAGLRTYETQSRTALRAIEEFMNEVAWYGDTARQIYGVLTHPNVPTMNFPIRWSTATGLDLAAQLISVINSAVIVSGGTMFYNRIAMAPNLAALVTSKLLDSSGGTTTVWDFVQRSIATTNGPLTIALANELTAAEMTAHNVGNPAGWDGMFLWNDSKESIAHVIPQEGTFLPIWNSSPIDTIHVAFGSTGGIVMNNVGSNLVVFVRA